MIELNKQLFQCKDYVGIAELTRINEFILKFFFFSPS